MFPIPELTALDVAFPANVLEWMPPQGTIPEYDQKFKNVAEKWFFLGLPPETEFVPKPGVDFKKALMAMKACLGSFAPKHEHKMAAAGFMLSEWFADIRGWEGAAEAQKETPRG